MKLAEIENKLLNALSCGEYTPENLFAVAEVNEDDARDILSNLVDNHTIIVGRNWILRLGKY